MAIKSASFTGAEIDGAGVDVAADTATGVVVVTIDVEADEAGTAPEAR
jgi:hypothetical protein